MSKGTKFVCPNEILVPGEKSHDCGGTEIEEIIADVTVVSEVTELELFDDGSVQHSYGEQTNEDGHVVRYQCKTCGYNIVDDDSEFANEGLDEHALAKAIWAINKMRESGGPIIDIEEILAQLNKAHEQLEGKELAEVFNSYFPEQQVNYVGDGTFVEEKE